MQYNIIQLVFRLEAEMLFQRICPKAILLNVSYSIVRVYIYITEINSTNLGKCRLKVLKSSPLFEQ